MTGQQIDSTYQFEGEETQQETVFYRPRTPYQAIRMLPRNATEDQKDDIVQKYFEPVITCPSNRPDTLGIPGLKSSKPFNMKEVPTFKDGFFKNSKYLHPELKVTFNGIPGDPIPYRLCNDVFITSTLFLSFFFAIFIIARSWHIMLLQLKNILYNRTRNEIFILKSDSELRNRSYVTLLACFLLSILFFHYTEIHLSSVFNQVSPYKLLLLDWVIFFFYFLLKNILYTICNWTFFSKEKRETWSNAYSFIFLMKALLLFPLTLLAVYFDISLENIIRYFFTLLILSQLLLIFKSKQIFFGYKFAHLHLFLYFCTLELIPLLLLWRALIVANEYTIEYI